MKKILFALLVSSALCYSRDKLQGYCQQGGITATIGASSVTPKVMASRPGCTVTVYVTGTLTLATLYSDNSGTALANPFTANSTTGLWGFYADDGRYDVKLSGGGIPTPFTLSDFNLIDTTGITSLNGLTGPTQTFATGTSGTNFNISSAATTHTFNIPSSSATNRGLLTAADWTTFNAKQSALTFTSPLVNTAGTVALTLPITIARGGTGQTTQTAGFNALSPLTTKGDVIVHNGTNNIRVAVGTNGYCLKADSTQASGLIWSTCIGTTPFTVSDGGTGASTLTGILQGNGTSAFTANAATIQLSALRMKANQTTTTYEFASYPYLVASDYDFPSQAPGGTLTAAVGASPTMTPCPIGLNGADSAHYIYISGGTGAAEAVLITGGTCTSGATTGTVAFTPANNHSGAWTITSATSGVQEAVCASSATQPEVTVRSAITLNASVGFCGKSSVKLSISDGATFSGAGSLPSSTLSNYVVNERTAIASMTKGSDVASANTIAPISGITHITGTTLVKTITVPSGFTTGCMVLIADAAFTTDTTDNVGRAITAVANTAYLFCYDGTKWYPSGQ